MNKEQVLDPYTTPSLLQHGYWTYIFKLYVERRRQKEGRLQHHFPWYSLRVFIPFFLNCSKKKNTALEQMNGHMHALGIRKELRTNLSNPRGRSKRIPKEKQSVGMS